MFFDAIGDYARAEEQVARLAARDKQILADAGGEFELYRRWAAEEVRRAKAVFDPEGPHPATALYDRVVFSKLQAR